MRLYREHAQKNNNFDRTLAEIRQLISVNQGKLPDARVVILVNSEDWIWLSDRLSEVRGYEDIAITKNYDRCQILVSDDVEPDNLYFVLM